MKQSDFTFKEHVPFSDMMEMAAKLVSSMYEDPDTRLNMTLGYEYLYLQAATRLFTSYGAVDGEDDIEGFMDMVFAVGVDRYEEWLRNNAGTEKYNAFKRMVERGVKEYLDMGPLEMLAAEAGKALYSLNRMMEESGGLTPDKAVELLRQYAAEQEEQLPQ